MDEVDPDHVRGDEDEEPVEGEGEEEDEIEMKVYTARELLQNTHVSIEARKNAVVEAGAGQKKKPSRLWEPEGEYELFRSGIPLLCDPDACLSALQERTLTLFKHTDPNVRYAEDPKRPMWKGVFTMGPGMGYGEGQYYDPKQTHLTQIYATEWPKKNRPADNMRERRDGSKTPYWIDAWQIMKNNEESHKRKSRKRRALDMSSSGGAKGGGDEEGDDVPSPAAAAPVQGKRGRKPKNDPGGQDDERAPIVEPEDNYIFPVSGWMRDHISKKETAVPTVVANSMLKTSPATALVKKMPLYVSQLAKGPKTDAIVFTGHSTFEYPKAAPKAAPVKAAVKVAAPPPPAEDEEEEVEKEETPLQSRKRGREPEQVAVAAATASAGANSPLAQCPPMVREILHNFAKKKKESAMACDPSGSDFAHVWFGCQPPTVDPEDFFLEGAPGDFIPGLATEISTRIASRMSFTPSAATKRK